jgi:hypothetical protein
MSSKTTKKESKNTKRSSASRCLAPSKSDNGKLRTIKPNKKVGNTGISILRDAKNGKFASQKSGSSAVTSVKGKSKGDKMFERAWEDTYENRKRRVG